MRGRERAAVADADIDRPSEDGLGNGAAAGKPRRDDIQSLLFEIPPLLCVVYDRRFFDSDRSQPYHRRRLRLCRALTRDQRPGG